MDSIKTAKLPANDLELSLLFAYFTQLKKRLDYFASSRVYLILLQCALFAIVDYALVGQIVLRRRA